MKPIHVEKYFLSAGETNAERELSLPLLVTRLIDIATAHANELGIGNPDMAHLKGGWVLSRLTIEMTGYPKVDTNYVISTWVESTNRHFSTRDFMIHDGIGRIYGYARSIWMIMNTEDHTNIGLDHIVIPEDMIDGTVVPIERQARHVQIVANEDETVPRGALVATAPPFDYEFQYSDLDFYRHVNTVRYVNLLINRFTLAEHDATFVSRLELSFMHEAKYGMQTQLLRCDLDSDMHSAFQLSRKADGQALFFARVKRRIRNLSQKSSS